MPTIDEDGIIIRRGGRGITQSIDMSRFINRVLNCKICKGKAEVWKKIYYKKVDKTKRVKVPCDCQIYE